MLLSDDCKWRSGGAALIAVCMTSQSLAVCWAVVFALDEDDRQRLRTAVNTAAAQPALVAAVRSLYDDFEEARGLRQPRCDASGECCRFEAHGHRLFVTGAELAAFLTAPPTARQPTWDGTGCPYQVDGLCGAREMRPFGCRVYFCDRSSDDWQHEHYERFQVAIRELQDRFGVGYVYAEWREALSAVGLPEAAAKPGKVDPVGNPVGNRRIVLTVVPAGR